MTIKAIEEKAIGTWNIGKRWHAMRLEKPQEDKRHDIQYT
jgi:hypothetical protein